MSNIFRPPGHGHGSCGRYRSNYDCAFRSAVPLSERFSRLQLRAGLPSQVVHLGNERWSANDGSTDQRRALNSPPAEKWKRWHWLALFRRVPARSYNVRQRNTSGIGGPVAARRKLLSFLSLCRQVRPVPDPLLPRKSGNRIASGRPIIDRDVPRSSAADLLPGRKAAGDASRPQRPVGL